MAVVRESVEIEANFAFPQDLEVHMFNRREFLKTTGLGLVSTAVSNPFLSEAQKPHAGRPNILLILVDDMG